MASEDEQKMPTTVARTPLRPKNNGPNLFSSVPSGQERVAGAQIQEQGPPTLGLVC